MPKLPPAALHADVDPLTPIPPPPHLSERSKALWSQYAQPERGNSWLALLRAGLESLDRSDQATAQLAVEGLTVVTSRSGVAHANPLLKVEKESRAAFLGAWRQAGLDVDERPALDRIFSPTGA